MLFLSILRFQKSIKGANHLAFVFPSFCTIAIVFVQIATPD
jgi:hypothetical protein